MRLFIALTCFLSATVGLNAATPAEQFHALLDRAWDYNMSQFPTEASLLGDERFADQWDKISPADTNARAEKTQGILKELNDIDREKLTPADQLNYDLFDKQLSADLDSVNFGLQFLAISQQSGLQTDDQLADALPFAKVKDYEAWIARLNAFPAHAKDVTALLQEGIKKKLLLPKILMKRVPPQIDQQIVDKPQDSPFYKPFKNFPKDFSAYDQTRLASAAEDAIKDKIVPAYSAFKKFFVGEYLPACPEKTGFAALPNGVEMYGFLVRLHTTTDLTPKTIHQIGLDEVARIRGEMEKVMVSTGYKGKLEDFFTFLRTDPKFYCKTGDEILMRYRAQAKRIDPLLVKIFKTLPRLPYGVESIPAITAPDTTTAYYLQGAADGSHAGTFYVNTYKPETRPIWEMVPLALHESVPGHHLQISLAMEQGDLPKFRRYGSYTAYIEGWGLYAESLGEDLGLYNDPYDKFGELTFEMWRSVRLVVDTGMHALGWDRQKAIDYFKANTPRSELDITNEVDRYLATPGQALAYKIGQLKIKQLREEAKLALGDKFDLREFHEIILQMGAVPMDILERNVKAWVASKAQTDGISAIPR